MAKIGPSHEEPVWQASPAEIRGTVHPPRIANRPRTLKIQLHPWKFC
jgi:hypothetical protein